MLLMVLISCSFPFIDLCLVDGKENRSDGLEKKFGNGEMLLPSLSSFSFPSRILFLVDAKDNRSNESR